MEKVDRQHPVEQDPKIRRTNFDAVENNFTDEQAALEALYMLALQKCKMRKRLPC